MKKFILKFILFATITFSAAGYSIIGGAHDNSEPKPSENIEAKKPIKAENDEPEDIEALLLQNLQEITSTMPEFMQHCDNPVYLSEKSRVILAVAGDINSDGNGDLAVVVEFSAADESSIGYIEGEFGFGPRHIYVLLGDSKGKFSVANKNESLILEKWMGGVFGDPLNSVIIEDGSLNINHYGGSSSRWGYDMRFAYENGQLTLVRMTAQFHSTYSANGEDTICDFLNHKVERYAWGNYFLYSGDLPDISFLFDNASFDEIISYANIPFLPNLDHYQFDRFDKPIDLKISASQALNLVMTEHYPDYEKVHIPWTQENRDNYSKLLFYEVPDYYYNGKDGTLEYFKLDIYEDNGEVAGAKHCVMFRPHKEGEPEFYYIEDE